MTSSSLAKNARSYDGKSTSFWTFCKRNVDAAHPFVSVRVHAIQGPSLQAKIKERILSSCVRQFKLIYKKRLIRKPSLYFDVSNYLFVARDPSCKSSFIAEIYRGGH